MLTLWLTMMIYLDYQSRGTNVFLLKFRNVNDGTIKEEHEIFTHRLQLNIRTLKVLFRNYLYFPLVTKNVYMMLHSCYVHFIHPFVLKEVNLWNRVESYVSNGERIAEGWTFLGMLLYLTSWEIVMNYQSFIIRCVYNQAVSSQKNKVTQLAQNVKTTSN